MLNNVMQKMEYKAETAGQVPHRIDGVEGRWYWVSKQQKLAYYLVCALLEVL